MRTRIDDELAIRSERSFTARDRMFDQRRSGEILVQLDDFEFFWDRKNGVFPP
jgi:hypothetical protein